MPTTTAQPVTDPQYGFIRDLLAVKAIDAGERGRIEGQLAARNMSRSQASGTIDWLKLQRRQQTPEIEALEIGVYVLSDGTIVKVQPTRDRQRKYSMRWVEIRGERIVDATGEHVQGEWRYEAGLIRSVRPEFKMTAAEAEAFGLRYGRCARCNRRLKAATSVERALGPVCFRYFSA